ncbi:hypothetical protein HKX48_003583 [Thoreauomyces humboldtii]|nr:hypothetical protein HKX48_003583 [Thoreauomyces humboldtii]
MQLLNEYKEDRSIELLRLIVIRIQMENAPGLGGVLGDELFHFVDDVPRFNTALGHRLVTNLFHMNNRQDDGDHFHLVSGDDYAQIYFVSLVKNGAEDDLLTQSGL